MWEAAPVAEWMYSHDKHSRAGARSDNRQVGSINDGTTAGSNVSLGTVNTSGNLSAVSNGILDLGTSTVGGNLSASSNNGHIVQTGALTVTGTSNLNAATGDITLINAGNDFTGAVSATGTVVTINDSNALTLGTVTSSGNLTLTNFGALNLGTSTVGGDLNATSNNGNISASGALTVSGNTNLNAGTGSVSVSGPAPAPAPAPAPSLDLASLTTAAQIQELTSAQIAGLSNEEVQSLTISQIDLRLFVQPACSLHDGTERVGRWRLLFRHVLSPLRPCAERCSGIRQQGRPPTKTVVPAAVEAVWDRAPARECQLACFHCRDDTQIPPMISAKASA